jgi:hypothetical protein
VHVRVSAFFPTPLTLTPFLPRQFRQPSKYPKVVVVLTLATVITAASWSCRCKQWGANVCGVGGADIESTGGSSRSMGGMLERAGCGLASGASCSRFAFSCRARIFLVPPRLLRRAGEHARPGPRRLMGGMPCTGLLRQCLYTGRSVRGAGVCMRTEGAGQDALWHEHARLRECVCGSARERECGLGTMGTRTAPWGSCG